MEKEKSMIVIILDLSSLPTHKKTHKCTHIYTHMHAQTHTHNTQTSFPNAQCQQADTVFREFLILLLLHHSFQHIFSFQAQGHFYYH